MHICTFQFDGVAMGSPLGPLIANVFMCSIEEQLDLNDKMPEFYRRYVDDTLTIMPGVVLVVLAVLVYMYNYSIAQSVVFSSWKTARLSSIFKKDDETDCGNYRLVSLLRVPSKILEAKINDRLVQHVFKDKQLITDKQWAYRRGYSTELLLVHLTEMCNVRGSHILKSKQ